MNHSEELIKEIQKGLLQWYPFQSDSQILYIGSEKDAVAELLAGYSAKLTTVFCDSIIEETWKRSNTKTFDYIVAIEALEQYPNPTQVLYCLREVLKEDGKMLLGMNNRLGIRYFCGDRDPYTKRNFDGVEGYRLAYSKKEDVFQGRCYSQREIKQMLEEAGWEFFHFFSVLPDLKNPSLLYEENILPNEDLANRLFPTYNDPETVFLEEASLYGGLIESGLFHTMANAYLIECSQNGERSSVQQITCSMERGRERALFTIIEESGIVKKQAAYPEGQERLKKLADHARDLSAHGISVVETRIENKVCIMPYMHGEVGQVYLKRLIQTDLVKFLQEMDKFRDLILQSSEIEKSDQGDGEGVILSRGYLDMVPLNSFYIDGTFVFYDQEFCEEHYPANAILSRMVHTFYAGNGEFQKYYPIEKLLERYGLTKKIEQWRKMEHEFLAELRKERELRQYHEACRGNTGAIHANRQRINYSEENYRRLFMDIFENIDNRKLILFGSGLYAKRFIGLYQQEYPVSFIVDNNQEKWGQQLCQIPIQQPDSLCSMQDGEYKVLICMKNYLSVMKQLDQMGIKEYSIFDPEKTYSRKRKTFVQETEKTQKAAPKKYHVGYIAGVFDLYHVGHLNMFRRAKEQCDYLIVGVVTDEGVRKYKKTEPFVPFEERIELVRSCRYVDEAVEIPLHYGGTRDAYRLYHFDCQFSGSDYKENPDWLADKAYLEKHGAEMVFFPYTERTSSTKIKGLIEKKLI